MELYLHSFLTSALETSEWSVSRPGHFTVVGTAPGTRPISGWAGPRAGPDVSEKSKIPAPVGFESRMAHLVA
jgi:hypothetical protein